MSYVHSSSSNRAVKQGFNPSANAVCKKKTSAEPIAQTVKPIEQAKQILAALSSDDKDTLLRDLFAQDLEVILRAEKAKIEEQLTAEHSMKSAEAIKALSENESLKVEQKLTQLNDAIKKFANQVPEVVINEEEDLLVLLQVSLQKIIGSSALDEKVNRAFLQSVATDYVQQHTDCQLFVGSALFEHVSGLNESDDLRELTIKEDARLLPFDFKLALTQGHLESRLEKNLNAFLVALKKTHLNNEEPDLGT